ncbi:MAG TPA: 6-pyruvoyl-tetrahydropterin synthase-related protein [Acidimicrobiia bacterium]|nr:6-pyruvoyl-tetrahydropterin synthase-related protein [Acidimicrobiia bacterium]
MVATRDAIDAPAARDDVRVPPIDRYERYLRWVGFAVVAACSIYVFVQLQPRLLFLNTTATGGDTGAHVWFPAYLRDHLLPHWRLAGWTDASYAGFPAGQFYFPFPALLIVLLNVVLPYNIAFKLVTVLGPVLLPIAAYVFGRGLGVRRPGPALMAVGATGFLFFKDGGDATMRFDHHIMGGTITNTLAGEYSFTIAVACALFFLGTFAMALDTRRRLWVPALFIAATISSHLVVGVFAFYGALVIWAFRHPLRNAGRAIAIGVVGVALTALWLVPLAATLGYTTDMRYEPIGTGTTNPWLLGRLGIHLPTSFDWMFLSEMWFLFLFALVAIGAGIAYRRRATLQLCVITLLAGATFCGWELLRDIFGKAPAWNLRLLPFWYLLLYLLAAVGAAELARWAAHFVAWVVHGEDFETKAVARADARPAEAVDASVVDATPVVDDTTADVAATPVTSGAAGAVDAVDAIPVGDPVVVATPGEPVPFGLEPRRPETAQHLATRMLVIGVVTVLLAGIALLRINSTRGYITYWAKYNYTGYEGGTSADLTKKDYAEYHAFIDVAKSLPPGRMLWEPSNTIGQYGTPLALMLLPYWTDGRIESMEGLYYESSATTPYHFLAAATLTPTPSNAVRGLPYRTSTDFNLGVRYLQLMGVRYYAAQPDMKPMADANPALRQVATVPDINPGPPLGWTIYEVADAPVVSALRYQPVVAQDLRSEDNWKCEGKPKPPPGTPGVDQLSSWECLAVPWFDDPSALDRPVTGDGPASWQRADMLEARKVAKKLLPPVTVSNVHKTDDSVDFDVSRTGVPVMVKVSDFPNWEAHGAQGPWRATPNFMVVVPTSHHVRLTYGTTTAEWVGRVGTVLGLAGLGALVWWGVTTPDAATSGVATSDAGAPDSGRRGRRRRVRFLSRSPR